MLVEEVSVGPCHNPYESPKATSSLGKMSEFKILGSLNFTEPFKEKN